MIYVTINTYLHIGVAIQFNGYVNGCIQYQTATVGGRCLYRVWIWIQVECLGFPLVVVVSGALEDFGNCEPGI
jgi:hypothetical protein